MFCLIEVSWSHLLRKALQQSLRLSETPATHRASAHAILSTSGLSGVRWFSKMQHQRSNAGTVRLTNAYVRIMSEMEALETRTVCWCEKNQTWSLATGKAADLSQKEPQTETLSHISDSPGPPTTDWCSQAELAPPAGWTDATAGIGTTLLWTMMLPGLPGKSSGTLHCGSTTPPAGWTGHKRTLLGPF